MLAITVNTPTWSQTTTQFGVPDCGKWVAERTASQKAWLLGFLSGLNTLHDAAGNNPKDPLDGVSSANQAYLWMDNWCKANPLKDVADGGGQLFLELMRKKKP